MRSIDEFLNEYGKTHRNPRNQLIHFVCVPVILISSLAFGWPLSMAMLGSEAAWAPYVNVATVASVLMLAAFYSRLGWRAVAAMVVFLGVSIAVIMAVESSPNIEGAKPSFLDDLVFLLIGPLFVLEEWGVPLRTK